MPTNPTIIRNGLNALFVQEMLRLQEMSGESPGVMSLATAAPSSGAQEDYAWLGNMPAVQEWLGELNLEQLNDYEYAIKNRDFAVPVVLKKNDIDDDKVGPLKIIAAQLAVKIMKHPRRLIVDSIINGVTGLAYDGVAFFSNASGVRVIDNLLAGTGTTVALLAADLASAEAAMMAFTDDQGEYLNIGPDTILCGPALANDFRRLVGSATDPTATATGTYNPFYNRYQVLVDARIGVDDPNDWYAFATREPVRPFVYQLRENARVEMREKDLTKQVAYYAHGRWNVGYGLPHLAVKVVNT